jgi:hypothetical protein
MMKQIKREESAEWKAWRDPMEAQVTSEVNKRPEYRALSFLRDEANPDGTPLDPSTRRPSSCRAKRWLSPMATKRRRPCPVASPRATDCTRIWSPKSSATPLEAS